MPALFTYKLRCMHTGVLSHHAHARASSMIDVMIDDFWCAWSGEVVRKRQAGTCARELLLCLEERRSSSKLVTPVNVTRLAAPACSAPAPAVAAVLVSAPWGVPSWFKFGFGFGPGSSAGSGLGSGLGLGLGSGSGSVVVGFLLGLDFGVLGVLGQCWR